MKMVNLLKTSICMLSLAFAASSIAAQSTTLKLASLMPDSSKAESKDNKALTDEQLADNVRAAFVKEKLFGKDKFADMGLHVTAKKGVVTLSGKVDDKADIDKAVKIARSVDQVKNVKSVIDVKKAKK